MRVVKRGGPNPISQEIVFFKSQLKSHNPSLCCSNRNPIPIFPLFFFHESQSQCTKSHFPASKKGKSQLPFYPFTTLMNTCSSASGEYLSNDHGVTMQFLSSASSTLKIRIHYQLVLLTGWIHPIPGRFCFTLK